MVLIGAGSGLSGLVAHIRQRASAAERGPVWLLFGERSRGHDAILNTELQDWLRRGVLRRLDRAFPRDEDGPRYVHELLRLNAATLADWDAQGAGFTSAAGARGWAGTQSAHLPTSWARRGFGLWGCRVAGCGTSTRQIGRAHV